VADAVHQLRDADSVLSRLPLNSLSDPQPATSAPINPPSSNIVTAELAVTRYEPDFRRRDPAIGGIAVADAVHQLRDADSVLFHYGPRLPLNSLSDPQPATSAPINPPSSNIVTAELAFAAGILLSVGSLWLMPFTSYVMQTACFFTTGFFAQRSHR
jgi:hypothetical protein